MTTNKHATIRYHALGQCFSNRVHKYYIEDLIDTCNDAIYESAGKPEGIKKRQIFDNINLFNAINDRKVLEITYQGFKQKKSVKMLLHPYYLKLYNNRWFLFALNENTSSISNVAIDRKIEIKETNKNYIENESIDFDEYFYDIVGVTVKENLEPVKIILQISIEFLPYIESKPIHGSQK